MIFTEGAEVESELQVFLWLVVKLVVVVVVSVSLSLLFLCSNCILLLSRNWFSPLLKDRNPDASSSATPSQRVREALRSLASTIKLRMTAGSLIFVRGALETLAPMEAKIPVLAGAFP